MTELTEIDLPTPSASVHVVEPGVRVRKGWLRCQIGDNIEFSTESLESYFFARWEPLAYEAMLVAAAAEFADKTLRRPSRMWRRDIALRIPVVNPDRWSDRSVSDSLHDVLNFLTGDSWHIEFYPRKQLMCAPQQSTLSLPPEVDAVIPFSNGMDSRAVAGLKEAEMGSKLVRVRIGSRIQDGEALSNQRQPFTFVPYHVRSGQRRFVESSARSRGFKFGLISALAAYLADAKLVLVPESGQGALGPALVAVGQAYPDYRSHPLFTGRMEKFVKALLGYQVRYNFPQLWDTKAETLRKFINQTKNSSWSATWSCWQQNRHSSVNGKRRHCGICAACMLRRLSVYAAGQAEPADSYVWENLGATSFWHGAAADFDRKRITRAMREYAIAGTLHLDHFAGLRTSRINAPALRLSAFQLSKALGISESDSQAKLDRLLKQHAEEWKTFVISLGENSFVADWALSARS